MNATEHPPDLQRIIRLFETMPHVRELGMSVIELRHKHGLMRIPCAEKLIGNSKTGVVHGGVVTTLLDTLSGLVVMASIPEKTPLATLDLRIDYLRPALAEQDIFASAECYEVTENIAFVRGMAYQNTFRKPIAHCAGTFMVGATGFGGKE